ncbi:hypothetical protein ACLKA6_006188 [Drosophila palustris]
MCNRDCCAVKTALQIRHLKQLLAKQMQEEIANPRKLVSTPDSMLYTFEDIQLVADFIIQKTSTKPKFGLVCGSNLDMLVKMIENPTIIDYIDIPMFPLRGQLGKLYVGTIMGATVIAMQGRFHYYEGNQLASSAVNLNYQVGDILLVKDHINMPGLLGSSPLIGPNDERFGRRHMSMMNAYDRTLLRKGLEIGQEIGYEQNMHTGVYACIGGPSYETATEQKLLRKIGIDVVGMSLVHEVIVARHSGLKVFAFSLITVPCFENSKYADKSLQPGQQACIELLTRLIYYIENDLVETPADTDKLTVGQTGYPDEAFRAID